MNKNIQLCKPITKNHRTAVNWLTSLVYANADQVSHFPTLQNAIALYVRYAESGNERFRGATELLLRRAMHQGSGVQTRT